MFEYPDLSLEKVELNNKKLNLNVWLDNALNNILWEEGFINIFGKTHKIPRLQAWYADKNISYKYSGKTLNRNNWNETLIVIKNYIESTTNEKFNSVLANLYRDGNDSMGLHADDEKELGHEPIIASLSLGASRKIYFKHKYKKINFNLDQNHGDLIVMKGLTQKFWKHEIKKEKKVILPRVNLTFRNIID